MELRSGKILYPLQPKSRKPTECREKEVENILGEPDQVMIEEVKVFFRSLYYCFMMDTGEKEWINNVETEEARRITVIERIEWEADKSFWEKYFFRTWLITRSNPPVERVLQVFPCFMREEYKIFCGNPLYEKVQSIVQNDVNSIHQKLTINMTLKLMEDHLNPQKNGIPKRVYFQTLASELFSEVIHLDDKEYPIVIPWEDHFKNTKGRCCYFPKIDGGITVIKSPISTGNFGALSVPSYIYNIIDSGEVFRSPEKNSVRALLLHKRLHVTLF